MLARRAWKSRKLEHELTSSHSPQPGAHTSTSYLRAAWNERSPVHISTIRCCRPSFRHTSSASSSSERSSSSDVSGRTNFTISTLSNWWPRLMPRTSRPADIRSRRKHGVYATCLIGSAAPSSTSSR
jgi:hypothetical protein